MKISKTLSLFSLSLFSFISPFSLEGLFLAPFSNSSLLLLVILFVLVLLKLLRREKK